jgi:hypothetical protein
VKRPAEEVSLPDASRIGLKLTHQRFIE